MDDRGYKETIPVNHTMPREVMSLEMTNDEAETVQNMLERYAHHLQAEIMHTDKRGFRDAMKQRAKFLDEIIDRLKTKIREVSS